MSDLAAVVRLLENLAPPELGEEWDNVGLLVGDPASPVARVMTCLTLTPDVVQEAIDRRVDLVVTHHPLPFRGVKNLTTTSTDGGSLWRLIRAGVAVYSPHTAYDSAAGGINEQWAGRLSLSEVVPLVAADDRTDGAGIGRLGRWSGGDFSGFVKTVKAAVNLTELRAVPTPDERCERIAVACGSGGSLLDAALAANCDTFVTGEMSFHDCLRCRSLGVGVVLTGHYASERFAVETLAERLSAGAAGVETFASRVESDPLVSYSGA